MTHPLIERALLGYRAVIDKQIAQFVNDAVGNIAIHEHSGNIHVTRRLDDKNQSKFEHLTEPNYYALIVNTQYGIFACPVVAMRWDADGTTRGWITLNPNEIDLLAHASNDDTDGLLHDHFATLHERDPLGRISDDEVYDPKTDLSIVSLEYVEFTLATRLVPRFGITYDYFELNNGRTTYREYPYSYIIVTREELNGIYSTVDL